MLSAELKAADSKQRLQLGIKMESKMNQKPLKLVKNKN
jgi:hypothetical protein